MNRFIVMSLIGSLSIVCLPTECRRNTSNYRPSTYRMVGANEPGKGTGRVRTTRVKSYSRSNGRPVRSYWRS